MLEKDELRDIRPESKAIKGDNQNKKGKSDGKNRGEGQIEKKPWKNNFKGKVAALKKQHKKALEGLAWYLRLPWQVPSFPPYPFCAAS